MLPTKNRGQMEQHEELAENVVIYHKMKTVMLDNVIRVGSAHDGDFKISTSYFTKTVLKNN
jgi:hypothetical protein